MLIVAVRPFQPWAGGPFLAAAQATSFTFAPTLDDVALSASLASTAPPSSSLAFAPTLADASLSASLAASTVANGLLAGLVAYLPLDEASGDALDAVGSYDWADHNSVGTAPGKVGTARSFDGSTQYLERPDTYGIGATSGVPFSITGWVWADRLDGNQIMMGRWDGTRILQLWTGSGGFWVNYGVSPFNFFGTGPGVISAGTWYHLAFTFSATGTGKLYLDGSLVATDTTPTGDFTSPGTPMALGRRGDGDSPFAGRIDELGLWGRELSADDVLSLYNGGSGLALSLFDVGTTAYFTASASLADVSLAASLTTSAAGASSITLAPTLAAATLSATLISTAPAASSFAAAPTLAPVALASSLATTTPAPTSLSLSPALADVALSSTFLAGASGATTFAVAGTIPTTLAATLATTQPAASALSYAANLADVALTALLTTSGPGSTSVALAATLANCTANLHLIASGGVVTSGRHPDAGRSTGVRLGPDPSRSQGRRLGPDPSRSTGSVT